MLLISDRGEKRESQIVVNLCLHGHACFCVLLQEERVNCSNLELFQDAGLHLPW